MSASTAKPPKDQYQHVIPRFILREFQLGPRKSRRERNKEYRKFRFVDERVWFYDIEHGTLEPRLIAGVYGVTNLYRDVRNASDVDEVEKKLSVLEEKAAQILQSIHRSIDVNNAEPTLSIVREDLEKFRKFLFLMHYRNEALSLSYFSPTHPENSPIRKRIETMSKRLNLKSPADMWLHYMRYYLDTPHSEIGRQAFEGLPNDVDPVTLLKDFCGVDPMAANFEAISYQSQAGLYYVGIVQAARGEEFILGHNTFGLWEGLVAGIPAIHRLFIVSPRIAVLLRLNSFRPGTDLALTLHRISASDLLDIPLEAPITKPLDWLIEGAELTAAGVKALDDYKASDQAKRDQYTSRITRLSKQQTYAINSVVLLNTKRTGSLTFLSPDRMRSTARKFWRDNDPASREERFKYEALIRRLSSTSPAITGEAPPSPQGPVRLHSPPTKRSIDVDPSPLPAASSKAPLTKAPLPKESSSNSSRSASSQTTDELRVALNKAVFMQLLRLSGPPSTPQAHYEGIRALWKHFAEAPKELHSHPLVSDYRRVSQEVIQRFRSLLLLKNPLPFRPRPNAELAETLSSTDAEFLFAFMDHLLDRLGFSNRNIAATDPRLQDTLDKRVVLMKNLAACGLLSWLAKNRHDCLDEFFRFRIYH
ncbi:putative protein of unknown function (DUF4238) [Lyophyllum shimeji]|uniref:DUF4238 domain-containing protein n=1 Tax=Lyophyllum shimeji TaxID=47721 RepID=A0A9P3PYE0_LYOSH|nr:putative protein of unknown function (DUF4238) [Lyophyllum shimeji]